MPSVINGTVFLTVSEVADRWKMSLSSVLRTYVQTGRLPTTRVGRVQLVSGADLERCEAEMVADLETKIENLSKPLPRVGAGGTLVEPRRRDAARSQSHVRGIRRARSA